MNINQQRGINKNRLTLARLPLPAKALVTMLLLTLSIGMAGAAGQILIHDIIPTLFSGESGQHGHVHDGKPMGESHHIAAATGDHDHHGNNERFFDDMADVSPAFFWLHILGGDIFGAIFVFVFFRGIYEMWLCRYQD